MIVQSLQTSGQLTVDQLTQLFGVSAITIRRDLVELETHGALRRVRGGASRLVKRGQQLSYRLLADEDRERKTYLAAAAAALVGDYETVIIDNGTTCLAVAHELAGRPITAMPLSLHAAVVLGSTPGPRVVVPGGPVEPDSLALLSTTAVDAVRAIRADVVVLGACAVSAARGLTSDLYEDAVVKRAAIGSSDRRILVTVADKLTATSSFRFAEPADLTHLVTTDDAPTDLLALFTDHGVEVTLV